MIQPIIKSVLAALLISPAITSCKSSQSGDPATFPKDIAERPADEDSRRYDEAALDKIKLDIESDISKEKCTRNADWTFAPMGAKACGGPSSYIAYPKKIESSILPKIEEYSNKMREFNKKYSISSDCMMAQEPTSVRCENGKGVLVY